MIKKRYQLIFLFLANILTYYPLTAQDFSSICRLSPEARSFLASQPATASAISNIFSEAFTNKELELYYFYPSTNTLPDGFHYYKTLNSVVIVINATLKPLDQCLVLMYEMLNSESGTQYIDLKNRASERMILKDDFIRDIMYLEFKTMKRMRDRLKNLKYDDQLIQTTVEYNFMMKAPDDFNRFFATFTRSDGSKSERIKEYEKIYDLSTNY